MMKKLLMTVLFFAAMAFAGESSVRPESAIPTPAEEMGNSKENRDLAAKEREDWQRMRAERKQARERILSEMRNKSAEEKKTMREEMGKNREESPVLKKLPRKISRTCRRGIEIVGWIRRNSQNLVALDLTKNVPVDDSPGHNSDSTFCFSCGSGIPGGSLFSCHEGGRGRGYLLGHRVI